MVKSFDTNSADIAMAGPWGSIYVTSETEFYAVDFKGLRNNVRYLYMTPYVLISRDVSILVFDFVLLILLLHF